MQPVSNPSRPFLARIALVVVGSLLLATGCRPQATAQASGATESDGGHAAAAAAVQTRPADPAAQGPRIVAIGDLHGDLAAARRALRLARLVDESDHWTGGNATLVQTGDILDRGDDEPELLDLFERLDAEARGAGGAVVALNGNHELMNVAGDLRYVTPEGFTDFAPPGADAAAATEARRDAFAPGGPGALRLARRVLVARVGDTLFAHGGVVESNADEGLEHLNARVEAWMRGEGAPPDDLLKGDDSPAWTRRYGGPAAEVDCNALTRTLEAFGAQRLVVGHTPQESGITSACDARLWRIDVGLSAHYGGPTEVLEIHDGVARALR